MTDAEVEALLDSTGGLLKLENMEHADDIMLEVGEFAIAILSHSAASSIPATPKNP
jgi:hypothetical protein